MKRTIYLRTIALLLALAITLGISAPAGAVIVALVTVEEEEVPVLTAEGGDWRIKASFDRRDDWPKDIELRAVEVDGEEYLNSLAVERVEYARFFDISLFSGENELQPEGRSVKVEIVVPELEEPVDEIRVVHFTEPAGEEAVLPEEGEPLLPSQNFLEESRLMTAKKDAAEAASAGKTELPAEEKKSHLLSEAIEHTVIEQDGQKILSFVADGFSVYGVIGTTIEKTVLASDGNLYHITVTYGPETGIPEDAELSVEEILPAENLEDGETDIWQSYSSMVGETLGWSGSVASYLRLFDIKIVDKEDRDIHYQPEDGTAVDVTIELADAESDEFFVVHFEDEEAVGDVIEAETEENAVSFEAHGFSAYAIVQGPSAIPIGWYKISSIEELIEKGSRGLYVGNPGGYYYGNTLVTEGNRTGIIKTKPAQGYPGSNASLYYFEPAEGSDNQVYAYCYAPDGVTKQYVYNGGNNSLSFATFENKTAFNVTDKGNDTFMLNNGAWYWNMQGGTSGKRFCSYNNANDANNNVNFWYLLDIDEDPYGLDGLSYGLMNWTGGVASKAMMASSASENTLDAKALTVMSTIDNSAHLFAPNDSDISMWTFHWVNNDEYRLITVRDGNTKYLKIGTNGLSLVSDENEAGLIQVVPGTGEHSGQICLRSNGKTLTFGGTVEDGFSVNGRAGSEWLNLAELSELTSEYFRTYSASKVSVSDETITNGSRVIIYTRSWNESALKYEYYAIGSDGRVVPVYESGDNIEWVSGQINTLLWNFAEYYWEGTDTPNFYYDLYNQYSEKYITPQVTGDRILSDEPIGIHLNGRRDGKYYSSILAWDEENYSYVGLKVEGGEIVPCPRTEAMDFYFAVMQDLNVDDQLTTVDTVDHTQYGITMKMVDYNGAAGTYDSTPTTDIQHTVIGNSKFEQWQGVKGLLATNLEDDGYPMATITNESLAKLFDEYEGDEENQTVNHLFIQSTYDETGYFVFDSTQNFASLHGTDFVVYNELGTTNESKDTLKHGQFMPYNDLEPGVFSSANPKNLKTIDVQNLSDSDPRKYEQLYLVSNPDYFFGIELEASFTQTPSGKDNWGHDIIFEFTGDDDFWFYVDGELVLDLGGIHSALGGSVNFRTGKVVEGINSVKPNYIKRTTLRDLFYSNYLNRDNHTAAEAQAYVDSIFEQNENGDWVFRDDTTHTMKMFYMERGKGASNLKMRFNLASVKKGMVQLTKELAGVDGNNVLAEYPFRILYKVEGSEEEFPLTDNVLYKDTINPVKYRASVEIDGKVYHDVFFLKPGESVDISFPEGTTTYRIVECAVNTDVYESIEANNSELFGNEDGTESRKDFGIPDASTDDRPKVKYVNNADPDALRTLTIKKRLYEPDGETRIAYSEDQTEFNFRLYMASEYDELAAANMQAYFVKDPDGFYCRWDPAAQKFVKIGNGIGDFAALSDEQKDSATFYTSIYGSIGRIPADFTVEIQDVLPGTKYRVEERPSDIPDGYSFQKYDAYDLANASLEELAGISGVNGTLTAGTDANVDICNLKGWGLRVNKIWRDADFMADRDATYFAVFIHENPNNGHGNGDGHLSLVEGTVRRLDFKASPQTLYWYFDTLRSEPYTGFDDYLIREVYLTGDGWDVMEDGSVRGIQSHNVHPIHNEAQMTLAGTQKGENTRQEFHYTVLYDKGQTTSYSNVRVDTVTNDRSGLILKKQDWNGTPLSGAAFELADAEGGLLGTFTSDDEGLITTAFLTDGKTYTLTETGTPQGYSRTGRPCEHYGQQKRRSGGLSGHGELHADAGTWNCACESDFEKPSVYFPGCQNGRRQRGTYRRRHL